MMMVRYSLLALTLAFLFLAQTLSLAGEDQGRNWKQRVSAKNLEVYSQQDVEEEIALGREIAARVLGRYPLYPDPQVQKYVNLIGQALAQNATTPELVFHFAVIDSPARKLLIAPGAYVFISSGAIRCMRDESELAGVLAHQIGHVMERHIFRELNLGPGENSALFSLATVFAWSSQRGRGSFSGELDQMLDLILKGDFKEELDTQADRHAIFLMALAKFNPAGLAAYWERVRDLQKGDPQRERYYEEKITFLRKTIQEEGVGKLPFRSGGERFAQALKGIIGPP